jgi:uncharacterized protein DUF4199
MDDEQFEDYEKITVKQVSIKWGLISGIISIAFFMIIVMADLVGNSAVSWLGYVPFIVILFLAHNEFKNQGDGYMSYSQGLGIGTMVALFSSLVSGVFSYIYTKFIVTDFYEQLTDKMVEIWEAQGMTDDQIEAASSMMSKFSNPELAFVFSILGAVFIGFIVTLIVAAITKKSNPELSV